MSQPTQAEIFIETLKEMRDDLRERQKAQLQLRHEAHAERFKAIHRDDFEDKGRRLEWASRSQQTAKGAMMQSRAEPVCTFSFITCNQNFRE